MALFVGALLGNRELPMISCPSAVIARFGDGSSGSFRLFPVLVVVSAFEVQPVVARYSLMRYAGMRCDQAGRFIAETRKDFH